MARIGRGTHATINENTYRQSPICICLEIVPNILIGDPFAATSPGVLVGSLDDDVVAGQSETCDPVSSKQLLPEILSWT